MTDSDIFILDVLLYDRLIGSITHFPGDRSIFTFNESYVDTDESRPTLSLAFKDSFGALIPYTAATQTKLHPFFSNLLPEGPLRDYLAKRAGIKAEREFFLLWLLGQDLPGAVTVKPANGFAWPTTLQDTSEDMDIKRLRAMRFSLAGVQLKFSAFDNGGKGQGLMIPVNGTGGSWIVKLPSMRFEGVPENEFAMMHLAGRLGMNVPEIKLVSLDDIDGLPDDVGYFSGKAFAIKRFDRTEHGPVHMEDFAQIFDVYPNDKYKGSYRRIAQVLAIETDEDSVTEFIRRMVFNTLIGNADMHLKNWSLLYADRKTPALSPAYDFVSTLAYMPDEDAALKYVKTKTMRDVNNATFAAMAAKASLPESLVLKAVEQTVESFLDLWHKDKHHLGLANHVVTTIDAHLATLALVN